MAQALGSSQVLHGDVDTFGGKFYAPVDYNGPSSYVTGGDTLNPQAFGMTKFLTLIGSVDQSGAYYVEGRTLANGICNWQLVWFAVSGGEVDAGTDLSGFTVRLSAIGI
jgi:hypothetical protein